MQSSKFTIAARTLFQRPPRVFEVERKFASTASSIAALRTNTGPNPFPSHVPLGTTKLHDTYYDKHSVLFSDGIYVWERNGAWESKVRRSGDFINSAFEEITDVSKIQKIVERAFRGHGGMESVRDLKDLTPVAQFETRREKWRVGEFGVVVDETSFGRCVGEVELVRVLRAEEGREEKVVLDAMDGEICRFMEEYARAFPGAGAGSGGENGKVVGKLSAYFAWKKALTS